MRASDRAYSSLLEDIIEGRIASGTVLAEVEQAERLGISRTPLREALGRLTADGLTAPHGGRGVVVTDISLDRVAELFELRQALECQAASLAALRGDPSVFRRLQREFQSAAALLRNDDPTRHDYYALVERLDAAVDQAAANGYLSQALRNLRVHLVRVRRLSKDNPERLLASAEEHATISEAIAAGDPVLAGAATAIHLHRSLQHLRLTHSPDTASHTPLNRADPEPKQPDLERTAR